MQMPLWVIYLSAGAYIAIMLAVLGVPQLLSSYFDLRARRQQEERQEERRREERRQDAEAAERRHRELMAVMIAILDNRGSQGNGQSELIRSLQQTIEELEAENDRLRKENGDGDAPQSS